MSPTHIIIALVIIFLIIFLIARFQPSDNKRRSKYRQMMEESNGEADESAKSAIEIIDAVNEKQPIDYYARNSIIEQNILGGNVGNASPTILTELIGGYSNIIRGIMGRIIEKKKGKEKAGKNGRRNAGGMGGFVAGQLGTAVDMMDQNTIARHGNYGADIYLLDRAEAFGENLRQVDRETFAEIEGEVIHNFTNALTTIAPRLRAGNTEERQKAAAETANNKREYVQKFIGSSIVHTDDRQNVHESMINKELKGTFMRLRNSLKEMKERNNNNNDNDKSQTSPDNNSILEEVQNYIETTYAGDQNNSRERVDNALKTLDTISRRNTITTFDVDDNKAAALNPITDFDILSTVWMRAKHPQMVANEDELKTAVVDALANSVEHGTVVCVNGRCSHLLNSGATIDPLATAAKTYESYKNEIFMRAKDILDSTAHEYESSNDAGLKSVAKSYSNPSIDTKEDDEARYAAIVKGRMDGMLENYTGKLTKLQIEEMRAECYASV